MVEVQVGTLNFEADKFCMPTTVSLISIENWDKLLPKEVLEFEENISNISDGYKIKIEITLAQTIQAGAIVGTCI